MDEKPENLRRPPREDDNRKILLLPETRMEKSPCEAGGFCAGRRRKRITRASLAADKAMDACDARSSRTPMSEHSEKTLCARPPIPPCLIGATERASLK